MRTKANHLFESFWGVQNPFFQKGVLVGFGAKPQGLLPNHTNTANAVDGAEVVDGGGGKKSPSFCLSPPRAVEISRKN